VRISGYFNPDQAEAFWTSHLALASTVYLGHWDMSLNVYNILLMLY